MRLKPVAVLLLFIATLAFAQSNQRDFVPVSLNGAWELLVDADAKLAPNQLPASGWRAIQVPLSIQAQFPDLRDFKGTAWYRRTFTAPALRDDERLLVRFGAVDYLAEVFVNGKAAGQHEGGYTPFVADATSAVKPGANTLLVRVTDPPPSEDQKQIPHGKQTWYVQTTGLWQDVWLERRPAYYLESAHALTDKGGLLGFRVHIAHAGRIRASAKANVEIVFPDGKSIRSAFRLKSAAEQTLAFRLKNARLWSPDDPALYRFTVTLPNGDHISDRFGFRSIEARDGKLYLNDKPYYMMGALDQDFYPEGIYSPPSKEYILREMRLARPLGLNTLRCHIKVPDPRYLEAADETGMLIWYEIPKWDELTEKAKRRVRQTFEEMTARDWNHPSVIIQSVVNESWGIDLSKADQRAWLAEMTNFARRNLPNRLVVDNSPCCGSFHITSDLADYHQYSSIPDSVAAWDRWVGEFASRPQWLWSKYGDARPTGQEPLIVSEFGNWGLPQLPEEPPWWFERGMGKSTEGITSPAGVSERFKQYGLERVFGNFGELAAATQRHEWEQLRHEIETIRLQPSIQGYVITEFTDLNWEANGLLTMWREPKAFAKELALLQQPIVVIATPDKPNYGYDQRVGLALAVANYSPEPLTNVTVSVQPAWKDKFPLPKVGVGTVVEAGLAEWTTEGPKLAADPYRQQSRLEHIYVELRDAGGQVLTSRVVDVPVIAMAQRDPVSVEAATEELRSQLRLAPAAKPIGASSVLITPAWDEKAKRFAAEGGSVIVLADSDDSFTAGPIKTIPRKGDLGGDWVSNFHWFDDTRPPFEKVAVQKIAGWETRNFVPRFLLAGVGPERYGDVLSGFFLGWIHRPHALTLQARHGKGRVIVTTWPLAAQYWKDPYATALLDALIRYIRGPRFDAKLEI